MKSGNGTKAAANETARANQRCRQFSERRTERASGTIARKTRFGRTSTATPAARPDAAALNLVPRVASSSAAIHQADTGTSLIAEKVIINTMGLTATPSAAVMPTTGPDIRAPSAYVRR